MNIDLTGQTALITGASRGIGAAIFRRLGEAGAAVVGTATGDSGLEAIRRCAKTCNFRGEAVA